MKNLFIFSFFLVLLAGCRPDDEKARAEVALETALVLDGASTEVRWGRKETDRGFSYESIPVSVCMYFIDSLPELARNRGYSIRMYSDGSYLDPEYKAYGEEIANACALQPQRIEVVKKFEN